MKNFRSLSSLLLAMLLITASLGTSGCAIINRVIAKDKLNQGAIAFNQGKFGDAYSFFKDAVALDASNPNGWLFYGASLLKKADEAQDDNTRKQFQQEAIDAYNKALESAPTMKLEKERCAIRDNAIGYLAKIYSDLGQDQKRQEWMLERTKGDCATPDVQAATFYSIGVDYWKCAYDETQRYADKAKQGTDPFHYREIYTAADKQKHEGCVAKGLEYIEKALAAKSEYADAYSYKSLLYREKQKVTKNDAERKKFADEAEAFAKKVMELNKAQAAQAPKG